MADTDSELTPPEVWGPVLEALDLSTFDLDPCSHALATVPATRRIMLPDNGLLPPWHGVVWCNPPYSAPRPWVERCADNPSGAIVLLSGDTSTRIWRDVIWPRASWVLFWYGRIRFFSPDNPERRTSAKRSSAIVCFGDLDVVYSSPLEAVGRLVIP